MSTFEVTAPTPTRLSAPAVVPPVKPVEAAASAPLDPAVRIDIGRSDLGQSESGRGDRGATAEEQARTRGETRPAQADDERRITIDKDTKSIVYQVLDPGTGTVLVQLPDVSVLKSRAYADAQAARKAASTGPSIARRSRPSLLARSRPQRRRAGAMCSGPSSLRPSGVATPPPRLPVAARRRVRIGRRPARRHRLPQRRAYAARRPAAIC